MTPFAEITLAPPSFQSGLHVDIPAPVALPIAKPHFRRRSGDAASGIVRPSLFVSYGEGEANPGDDPTPLATLAARQVLDNIREHAEGNQQQQQQQQQEHRQHGQHRFHSHDASHSQVRVVIGGCGLLLSSSGGCGGCGCGCGLVVAVVVVVVIVIVVVLVAVVVVVVVADRGCWRNGSCCCRALQVTQASKIAALLVRQAQHVGLTGDAISASIGSASQSLIGPEARLQASRGFTSDRCGRHSLQTAAAQCSACHAGDALLSYLSLASGSAR
jgi:hypothetical protein